MSLSKTEKIIINSFILLLITLVSGWLIMEKYFTDEKQKINTTTTDSENTQNMTGSTKGIQLINKIEGIDTQKISWEGYEWIKKYGIWQDKKTGNYQCNLCKSKGIIAPLQEVKHGWYCQICKEFYEDKDNPRPTIKRKNSKPEWRKMMDRHKGSKY